MTALQPADEREVHAGVTIEKHIGNNSSKNRGARQVGDVGVAAATRQLISDSFRPVPDDQTHDGAAAVSDDLAAEPAGEHDVAETPIEPVDGGVPVAATEQTAVDGVAKRETKQRFARSFREWALVVVIAIGAAVLMKAFVVQQFYVSGSSMINTLQNDDRVLVNKLSYELHDPNRGDVVVLEESQSEDVNRDLIKRVIALPGEIIEMGMEDCVVKIDGRVLVEPYLDPTVVTPNNCGQGIAPITVPAHHVFVMGDNRPGSGDSRGRLGPVDFDQIVGRAFVVIWPQSDWKWL